MDTLNEKDFSLIENYISGALNSDEEKNFKKRLKTDLEFAKNYRYRTQLADNWLKADEYIMTKEQVKDLFKQEKKSKTRKTSFFYAAASIALLIGMSVFYMQQSDQNISGANMANMITDTNNSASGLSFNEQPIKGTQYIVASQYTNLDTLKVDGFDASETKQSLQIVLLPNKELVKEIAIELSLDSLFVPLNSLQVGKYKWQIPGTDLSGYFDILENSEQNN